MKRWVLGVLWVWGGTGWATEISIPVQDGSQTYAGVVHVGSHYPDRLGSLAHYVPGLTTLLVAGTSRLVSRELEARESGRPIRLTYGNGFEVETEFSTASIEIIVGERNRYWLVPDTTERDPQRFTGADGPLQMARVDGFRFQRRRDPQNAPGQLQAHIVPDAGPALWIPLSALVRPVNKELFLGSHPILFAETGEDWRQSEPVEWMEMRPGAILALSRRELEAYAQGQVESVTLYRISHDHIRLMTRLLWYLQPERPIPGEPLGQLRVRRREGKTAIAILAELRATHAGGRLSEPTPVEKCGQAFVRLKDWFFDELHLYAGAFRAGVQRQEADRNVSGEYRLPAVRGVR